MENEKSVKILNNVLRNEFTAILQYFLHAKFLVENGLYELGQKIRKTSIDEMHHAEILIDRIFYLNGKPEMVNIGGINLAFDVENIFKNDLKLEVDSVKYLQSSVNEVREYDSGTEGLLKRILESEEKHIDWIKQQLELIKLIGAEGYIQKNG